MNSLLTQRSQRKSRKDRGECIGLDAPPPWFSELIPILKPYRLTSTLDSNSPCSLRILNALCDQELLTPTSQKKPSRGEKLEKNVRPPSPSRSATSQAPLSDCSPMYAQRPPAALRQNLKIAAGLCRFDHPECVLLSGNRQGDGNVAARPQSGIAIPTSLHFSARLPIVDIGLDRTRQRFGQRKLQSIHASILALTSFWIAYFSPPRPTVCRRRRRTVLRRRR